MGKNLDKTTWMIIKSYVIAVKNSIDWILSSSLLFVENIWKKLFQVADFLHFSFEFYLLLLPSASEAVDYWSIFWKPFEWPARDDQRFSLFVPRARKAATKLRLPYFKKIQLHPFEKLAFDIRQKRRLRCVSALCLLAPLPIGTSLLALLSFGTCLLAPR